MTKLKEEDLFDPVKQWLEEREYTVYAEVTPSFSSKRADIVAINKPAVSIIEMKTSLTLELLDQAFTWKHFAHYIYIAIPKRTKPLPRLVHKFLVDNGIGLLEVNKNYSVYNHIKPRFNRPLSRKKIEWEKELLPEHQTWVKGGNAGGGYVTPYKLTVNRVKEYLKNCRKRASWDKNINPDGWCMIKEILDNCETHYSRPKNSLSNALLKFEWDWCEHKKENGKLWFRYKGDN